MMLPQKRQKVNQFGAKCYKKSARTVRTINFFEQGVVPQIKGLYINQDFTY